LSHLPRVQEENDPKAKPAAKSIHNQRSQSHIPLASTIAIFILKPAFIPTPHDLFRIPNQLSQISFAILPAIKLHHIYKPNPYNSTNHHLPCGTPTNNISHIDTQPTQPKTKPNNLPQPPPQNQESSQQGTNFPTFGIIHTITGGSNLSFENKRHR
jgi:hypothetical protein